MKIVIIEGTDNIGKDTIISKLLEDYNVATVIHCSSPKSKDPIQAAKEQDRLFNTQILNVITNKYNSDVVIFNRSFIGEYVYGVLYRNRNNIETLVMINKLEDLLNTYIDSKDLIYIQLLSSSTKLMQRNDDNKSLSEGDVEYMEQEISLFKEVFHNSNIENKHLIFVNHGDEFRDLNEIINEVKGYIQ